MPCISTQMAREEFVSLYFIKYDEVKVPWCESRRILLVHDLNFSQSICRGARYIIGYQGCVKGYLGIAFALMGKQGTTRLKMRESTTYEGVDLLVNKRPKIGAHS